MTEDEIQNIAMVELRKVFSGLKSENEHLSAKHRDAVAEAARWREEARRAQEGDPSEFVTRHPDPIALAEVVLERIPVEQRTKLVDLVNLREEIREAL